MPELPAWMERHLLTQVPLIIRWVLVSLNTDKLPASGFRPDPEPKNLESSLNESLGCREGKGFFPLVLLG